MSEAVQPGVHSVGRHTVMTAIVLLGLCVGAALHLASIDQPAHLAWAAAVVVVLAPLTWSVLVALRSGRLGVDLIALLAMAGALATGEYLAGAVIALMMAGGNALEELAQGRASRELSSLASRAPHHAHIHRDGEIVEVDVADVRAEDVVVVRAGEVVPVDGMMLSESGTLDQAALTGEPLPVTVTPGALVMSGSANAAHTFEIRALRTARESMYASIVRLVEQALARKAPMVRMADRYSVLFLAVTLVLSATAWISSGDPVRALAVLVIATPCPLILAPPVALVAGTSRAARKGVIVKGSAAIENLGRAGAVLIDKTGTITLGSPEVTAVVPMGDSAPDDLLRLAGSVEQMSVHPLAEAIAHRANETGPLAVASDVQEHPGHGIRGTVDGHRVVVGSASYLERHDIVVPPFEQQEGAAIGHIAVDGAYAGRIELADNVREDAAHLRRLLGNQGIRHVVMATGDHQAAARRVADAVGISEYVADCTPQRKLDLIHELKSRIGDKAVIMVGDGVNDAPALAAADIGIAMGSAGATAASESAEAVILTERITLVAEAIAIGRRSRSIALQSVIAGMALSIAGMFVAAAGYLPPVYGALSQEVIDLAVIVNALRALRSP